MHICRWIYFFFSAFWKSLDLSWYLKRDQSIRGHTNAFAFMSTQVYTTFEAIPHVYTFSISISSSVHYLLVYIPHWMEFDCKLMEFEKARISLFSHIFIILSLTFICPVTFLFYFFFFYLTKQGIIHSQKYKSQCLYYTYLKFSRAYQQVVVRFYFVNFFFLLFLKKFSCITNI